MGNRIYDNDFEEFLKEQSDDYRMYPSDHVWRSIHKEVHGYSKWPALTVIAIFIISALVVGTVITKPHISLDYIADNTSPVSNSEKLSQNDSGNRLNATSDKKNIPVTTLSIAKITQETIDLAKETVQKNYDNREILIIKNDNIPGISGLPQIAQDNNYSIDAGHSNAKEKASNSADENTMKAAVTSYNIMREMQNSKAAFSNLHFGNKYKLFATDNSAGSTNNYSQFNFEVQRPSDNSLGSRISRIGKSTDKLDFQFYVTPSISYRRLVDNAQGQLSKSYISALPYAANYVVDVDQVINHKASTGLEVGFNLGYNFNKKLAVRSGFQFNMQQYKIDAYVHSSEPATIALSDGNSNMLLNTVSGFGSVAGSEPIELTNRYYQISVPVAIDWRPLHSGKFSWGFAAAIQPTYTFDKEPFIITSNYKNYADGSQLMRNWNINTNFETYVGYTAGKYRWQLGPQFRYQLMPTMANNYPIKEYLLDYGIKLGLVRMLK